MTTDDERWQQQQTKQSLEADTLPEQQQGAVQVHVGKPVQQQYVQQPVRSTACQALVCIHGAAAQVY